ncbi:MAG: hypothetical protein E7148_01045 [Rikenellaceae bacterium]|nr:hypothetical protein [Rikenellaceae bacterium]
MPKYIVNGKTYNIPDDKVEGFENKYPNATVEYHNDDKTYRIPLNKREGFLKQFPNASTTAQPTPTPQPERQVEPMKTDSIRPTQAIQPEMKIAKEQPVHNVEEVMQDMKKNPDDFFVSNSANTEQQQVNRIQVSELSTAIDEGLNRRAQELDIEARNKPSRMQPYPEFGMLPPISTGREEDSEYRTYFAAKNALKDAQRIIDEADRSINAGNYNSWLSDTFVGGAARGFGEKFFDVRTWDFGITNTTDNLMILRALNAFDKGLPLTDAQRMLLDAKAVELATNAYFGSYLGRGYKAGSVTAESIPFMLEMAISPLSTAGSSATSKLARYALSRYAVVKAATRVAGDIAGAAGMAATTGVGRVAGGTLKRMQGKIVPIQTEDGQTVFGDHVDVEDFSTAFAKSFAGTTIENYSEMFGTYFGPILGTAGKGISKGLDKVGLSKVNQLLNDIQTSDLVKLVSDFEKNAQWNGLIGEYAEEVAGNIMNAVVVEDMTLDTNKDTGVFNLDQNIDTFLGVSLLGGSLSFAKTIGYAGSKYNQKRQMDKADIQGSATFGADEWKGIHDALNENADKAKETLSAIMSNPEISNDKKVAALNYAGAVQKYRGAWMISEKKIAENPHSPQSDKDASFDNGYTLEAPQEMNDAKNSLDYQRQNIRRLFGTTEDVDVDKILGNDITSAIQRFGLGNQEIETAIQDYFNAKATYDGMIQRQRDNIDTAVAASDATIDSHVSQTDGMIHPAKMNVDDRPVYVVSGNIVMNDDNTGIDRQNSDESIIIVDADTGRKEFTDPASVLSVDPAIDPLAEKQIAQQQIREQMSQQASDKIEGVLAFQPNDQYILTDEQGVQHTAQVVMDNGDGTVAMMLDNVAEPQILSKEAVQQMAEMTNLARLNQFEQEKAAERIAQAEAEREAQRPVYRPKDRITLRTADGSTVYGIVTTEADENGMIEVYTGRPIKGKAKVALFSRDELDAMVIEHNGGSNEMVEEQQQVMQPTVETVQQSLPIEQPAQVVERKQQEEQEPASILSRIPVDEQGNPQFEEAPVQDTWAALVEMNGGDTAEALDTAQQMLSIAQKELNKVQKQKSKGGTNVMEIQRSKDEQKAKVQALQTKVQYWTDVAGFQSEQERMAKIIAKVERKAKMRDARAALDQKGRYAKENAQLGDYLDFRDFVMRSIATGGITFKWADSTTGTKGLGAHLGLKGSRAEMGRRIWMLNNETGEYPEVAAERLLQGYANTISGEGNAEEITGLTSIDALNEVLDVIATYDSPRDMFAAAQERHADIEEDVADYEEELIEEYEPIETNIPTAEEYEQAQQEFEGDITDNQNNPLNLDGALKIESVDNINDITDDDFETPYRNVQLPQLPNNVQEAIGVGGRPIVIKKSIFEKNGETHVELSPTDSREILQSALYNPNLVGTTQPIKRPDYKVAIQTGEKNAVVVLDVYRKKDYVEIVGWRKVNARGLEKMKRQAEREGGQFLILSPNEGSAAALSALPSGLSSESKDTTISPNSNTLGEKVAQAEAEVNIEPTEKQKEAGNYKKGHVQIGTFNVTIEQPKGSVRSGVDANGNKWETTMQNTYGYIRGTEGVDGDHIDVFLSDDIDGWNGRMVFVVDQVNPSDGSFDEHKVMMGFNDLNDAETAYLNNYEDGWQGLGTITGVPVEEFEKWIDSSHRKTKPFAEYKSVKATEGQSTKSKYGKYQQFHDEFIEGLNAKKFIPNISQIRTNIRQLKKKIKALESGMAMNVSSDEEFAKVQATVDDATDQLNAYNDILDTINKQMKEVERQAAIDRIDAAIKRIDEHQTQQKHDDDAPISMTDMIEHHAEERNDIETLSKQYEEAYTEYFKYPVLGSGANASTAPITVIERVRYYGSRLQDALKEQSKSEQKGLVERRNAIKKHLNDIQDEVKRKAVFSSAFKDLVSEDDKYSIRINKVDGAKRTVVADLNTENIGGESLELSFEEMANILHHNNWVEAQPNQEKSAKPQSGNKLVTDERYAELRERMRKKLGGQMNMGIDPEILAIGTEMAVYHVEKGARKFIDYAKAMIEDMGDAIRPYLKAFYNGARELPEVDAAGYTAEMTPYDEVRTFDVANFDKENISAMATAETVAREMEVEQEAEVAQDHFKKLRSKRGKSEKKTVTSQQSLFNNNEDGAERNENSRTDNSGTQLGSEALSDPEQVGARTSVQNATRNSESERRGPRNSRRESGNGPQYDVNKNYTNEEISEIVSSVTDIAVNGKVVITGTITDDIKAICHQYESGGVAKKGRGILDEYYTDGKIVDAVNMLIAPYFKTATAIRVLEPSVGTGNFIEAVKNIQTSEIAAFEINETTARIAKVLYPNVDVNLRSFETEFIDDTGRKKPLPQKYNLVIGNPPYGSHRGFYKGLGEESKIARYEDYFVKRSLDVLDEGGVLAMVLPSSWIDRHSKYGGYTIEAAYRLPSGAFEATQVGTDIVVLKKDTSIPVTEHAPYFQQYPERVLGEVKQRKGRYGKMEEYVEGSIDDAIDAIEREHAEALAEQLNIDKTNDNLNDIQSAIEETGSADKAKAIVESEKAAENKPSGKTSTNTRQGKYKVELNRGAETVPTSAQFSHEFSEGEVEAFADTDYDGTVNDPAKHRKYVNYIGGKTIHDFYYAEGDIYSKLAQLEQERGYIVDNFGVEQYEKQKRLLENVLPKQKGLSEITISPNTAFVKNLHISTDEGSTSLKDLFITFLRNLPYEAFGNSSSWEVVGYVQNEQVYGQDKQRNQLIRERRKQAANDLFVKFLNEELSEGAREQVVKAFNREYNAVYRPDYSKVPLFSNINKDFKGRPLKLTSVQLAGIGRMTVKGVGVLAHEVGFGKTLSGVLAMHEAMTRGFAKKPLVIVPNDNILKQWVETINEALPNATVNTLGNLGANYDLTDFEINDGEFTIMTYEGLKAMSFSDATYNRLAARFSYITEDLTKHQSERDAQKRIEKQKELKGKMIRGAKTTYGFEDFGFDWLTFDEVHNANHIVSKVRLDKSVASDFRSQSQRTSDLGLKTWLAAQYIQEENNGRNVLLLSATPFTNKPLEYYSILSLVANKMLERKGFFNVDQFFATFMEADNELEIGANGRPQQKTNVRRFRNNGLFQQLLSEFIDIKGEEDNPELVRPERHNKEYKIAQNDLTAEVMAEVQGLLSDNDTVLQGIGHARAAAFSPYATSVLGLKPKNYREFVKNSPKIDATIKMIEQNKKDRPDAGQIVYSEVGVEFFPMIRDYLVKESGFKPEEVRIITGATSNSERINIQTAFNDGVVKVVIGSPAIKEGLNLQGNTTDMYILSLPWNFTQLRQIEGRGWRQGNKWENIRINYMLTNDSVDVFMLQRLQLKQGLYNEAMKSGAESLDVSDIDTAELKTALITDPSVRAEIVTVQERAKLNQERTQVEADLSFVTRKYEDYNKLMRKYNDQQKLIDFYRKYAEGGDSYWAERVEREKVVLQKIANEIEQEKQNLLKKGVNVDDIERQTEQARKAIENIQERIDNLKEYQQELTEKYRKENEAKAEEQGDLLSTYIKERKAENKGGFYKIRPPKNETEEDTKRYRRGDDISFAHEYDADFAELDTEFKTLNKTDKAAVKAWKKKKLHVVEDYLNLMSEELGLPCSVHVFDHKNEYSLNSATRHVIEILAEIEGFDPKEAYSEENRNGVDFVRNYLQSTIGYCIGKNGLYNIGRANKENNSALWLNALLHENAHFLIKEWQTENELSQIWSEALKNPSEIVTRVQNEYADSSDAKKGGEVIAYTVGNSVTPESIDAIMSYIKGDGNISLDDIMRSYSKSLPLTNKLVSRIFEYIKYEYQQRREEQSEQYIGENQETDKRAGRKRQSQSVNLRNNENGRDYGNNGGRRDVASILDAANQLATELNTPIRIIEDIAKIPDPKIKAWYDIKTNEVVLVAPNATSIEDAQQSILHEVVAHKGLRELVGKDHFEEFLDKVFRGADKDTRAKIVALATKNDWNFRLATEEYMAGLAEQGFENRTDRNFFEKVRDLFLDMLRRAKIALGYRISDNDLRYMLWRSYQMQRSKGAMAVAENVDMQRKLGVGNFRTRQMSEEEQIVAQAKKDGTYLKAPNGQPTNLTPKQWAQVRTKAFKKWFGDWEKAARIEKLKKSESVIATGEEYVGKYELNNRSAADYINRELRGEYTNKDTGTNIKITRKGAFKVTRHDAENDAHLKSIALIPQMLGNAIFITEEQNDKNNTGFESYRYYVIGLNMGGVDYTAKLVIGLKNGETYYDHALTEIEKANLINGRDEISSSFTANEDANSIGKDKRLISILQTNASKVVDANGEPKVVEHSTWNDDFYIFDMDRLGESSGDEGLYGAGFYFGNVGRTAMYGDRAIQAYLNMRKPLILPEDDIMTSFDYLVENFDKQGLRDIVVKNGGKSASMGEIIDAIKEVQANHRNGEYNELIEEMKQYWTPSSAEDRVIEQTIFRKVGFAFYRALTPFIEKNIGQREFTEALRNAGYDGVIFNDTEFVVYNPSQIKSATDNIGTFNSSNDDIRYRRASVAPPSSGVARQKYNKAVRSYNKSGEIKRFENMAYRLREAYQDSMLSLRELYSAILEETGNDLHDFEDAYKAENRMSSENKAQAEIYMRDFYKPLQDAVRGLIEDGAEYNDIVRYMIAKHGLERNEVFSKRDAEKDGGTWDGEVKRDYSGLTELTQDSDNFTDLAQQMVDDFESEYDTTIFWDRVNAATKETLRKSYESGLYAKDTYEQVRDMFQFYIPLRGWDANVAANEYEYLSSNRLMLSPTLKTAHGRKSIADDPLATIGYMAESAIVQGNRNLMKQNVDDLRKLRDYPCEPYQEKYRDLFMLTFYLLGINPIDLFSLKEIINGRIEYRRSKTGRLFSIKVEPEAMAIIDKYRGEDFLLDVLDIYGDYKDFAHRMNSNLQKIGPCDRKGLGGRKYIDPLFPKISIYWARHTWATLAAEIDIPDDTIALGHSSGNRVTNIYQKKVDVANRAVIDYLRG